MRVSDSSKKQEIKTYQSLGLGRESKSRAGRRKAERDGVFRFIGGDSPDRPYLRVVKASYLRVWKEVQAQLQKDWASFEVEETQKDRILKPLIEQKVYETLAQEAVALATAETNFQQSHGRRMTPHETELFAKTLKLSKSLGEFPKHLPSSFRRKQAVQTVLQRILEKQGGSHASLQQAWAEAVGPEIAMESALESIQSATGVAYARCMNPAMKFELQRNRQLLAKLSKALNRPIKKIILR